MNYQIASTKTVVHPFVRALIALLLCLGVGYLGAKQGISVIFMAMSFPFVILYFIFFFRNPKAGVYTALILGFILPILGRYSNIPIPWGLGVDILLVLTYLILFLKHWKYLDFRLASNDVVLLMSLWMGYILFQIVNPEARSIAAWFYTMRGMGLYQFLIIPLGFILFNSRKDWYNFFNLWLAFAILAILWALKQSILGVSAAEQAWLDAGAATTHILFGKLRIFSYYFDAGTFGASMGQISIMCFILFLGPFSLRRRIFYFLVGLFGFYALMLSGTRGALAVPAIGGILYLIMIRNVKLMVTGAVVLFFSFSFLTEYLKGKPFGGGLGSSGVWGQKFSPHTWLANFPPDGLYTRIRAETGLIGRLFYVGMWLYILGKGVLIMWKLKREEDRVIAMAFLAGYAGILMANYGNEVMTQFPISVMTFLGIPIIMSMKHWNEEGEVELPNGPTPVNGAVYPESRWLQEETKE